MSIDLLIEAKGVIVSILNRLDQMKSSGIVAARIKDTLEHLQSTIEDIEPHIAKDADNTKEIKEFLAHISNIFKSCDKTLNKHAIKRFLAAPKIKKDLNAIESEVKIAVDKLLLFINSSSLAKFSDATEFVMEKLTEVTDLLDNSNEGIYAIEDESVTKPSAPAKLKIEESKNTFTLSWEPPSVGTVDEYEVCYNDKENRICRVGKATTVILESPRVSVGKLYTMKVRGINKGGRGEWSDCILGKFKKPLPQTPEISNLSLLSTIAIVTIKIPGVMSKTESPVTRVKVAYASATDKRWTDCEFNLAPGKNDAPTFMVNGLQPDTNYNFMVKSVNAEGWSNSSCYLERNTSILPPKPFKPDPPIIEAETPSKVKLVVEVPENTCVKTAPIIEWKVSGYSKDKENKKCDFGAFWKVDHTQFTKKSVICVLSEINPDQKYTLQLFAKNESEWSLPSEEFIVCQNAMPSEPKDVRVSSYLTHCQIKIRWKAPELSPITHYEIMKKKTKVHDYNGKRNHISANKIDISATFRKLEENTHYSFLVRTCSNSYASKWIVIEAMTRKKNIRSKFSQLKYYLGTADNGAGFVDVQGKAGVGAGIAPVIGGMGAGIAPVIGSIAIGAVIAPIISSMVGGIVSVIAGAAGDLESSTNFYGTDDDISSVISEQSDDEDAIIIED